MFTSAFPPSSPELSNGQVGLYIMLIPHRLKGNHHIWGVHVITLVVVGQFCFSLFTGGLTGKHPNKTIGDKSQSELENGDDAYIALLAIVGSWRMRELLPTLKGKTLMSKTSPEAKGT